MLYDLRDARNNLSKGIPFLRVEGALAIVPYHVRSRPVSVKTALTLRFLILDDTTHFGN